MKPRNPFIFRVYTVAGEPDRQIVLTIGKPRPALGDWACRVRISGIPKGREDVAGGDPLQAMQLAIVFELQRKLERYIEREDKRFNEAVAALLKEKERLKAAKRRAAKR